MSESSSTNPQQAATGLPWQFGVSDEAFKLYNVSAFPTTVFIDKTGKVVDTVLGGMDKATFEAKLAQIL